MSRKQIMKILIGARSVSEFFDSMKKVLDRNRELTWIDETYVTVAEILVGYDELIFHHKISD